MTEAGGRGSGSTDDLVEVARAAGQAEAELIQSVLAGSGIESALRGEALRLTHGLTMDGLAEVRILVRPEDRDAARAALDESARQRSLRDEGPVGHDSGSAADDDPAGGPSA
jgi:hypothetical protein